MMKYRDYLNEQIELAAKRFEVAKQEAIRNLENMTVFDASFYGAGYAAHIDNVTAAARELETLNKAFRRYDILKDK